MKVSAKTKKQLEEALSQVVAQCPTMKQTPVLSDLYVTVEHETGEMRFSDDDERELCRCTIAEWRKADKAATLREARAVLQEFLAEKREQIETINFLRPFSFVMVDAEHETIADLYLVDEDTILIPGELMEGLEDDLNDFLRKLMEE